MKKTEIILSLILSFCLCLSAAGAQSQSTSGIASGHQDKIVTVAVNFKPLADNGVSAISFHMEYNSANLAFKGLKAGPVVLNAGKSVTVNGKDKGVVRCIIFGLNDSIISEGVLAEVSFDVLSSDTSGRNAGLRLTNYSASSPEAAAVPLTVEDYFILVVSKEKLMKVKIEPVKRFLIWRSYKLSLDKADKMIPVSWGLTKKQKLPFMLRLNKKKGTIYGIVWGKKIFEFNVNVTTQDKRIIELPCKLEIK